jgi:drug/metabolite transporter (DMT)-like permease
MFAPATIQAVLNQTTTPQQQRLAYGALAITSTIWGSTWVVSKLGVQHTHGLQVSFIRQFIAGSIFLLYFLVFKKEKLPTKQQFAWLFMMSVIMFVFANAISTWSIQYIPSGLGALIGALYPLSVAIIQMLFLKYKPSWLTMVGLLLGFAGVGFVLYENAFHQQPKGYVLGVLLALFAMLSWSVGTILLSRNKFQINPYYATGWQMVMSSVMVACIAYGTGVTQPFNSIAVNTWWAIAYLVTAGSVLTFVAFIYSLKHLHPTVASLYAYINPLVAIGIGNLVLQEPFTTPIIIGTIITLIGVFLVNKSMKQ